MTKESIIKKNIKVTVELEADIISHLDELRTEWGYQKRGEVLSHLLKELFTQSGE